MEERLQKVIANRGYCSRRQAEELIEQGRVSVNGEVVKQLGTKVSMSDMIEVDAVMLERVEPVYYVLNKPRGYISTVDDEFKRKSVVELIPPSNVNERIYPVGRLDKDTTGLLVLTNDGEFMNAMTHPKHHIQKKYIATVEGLIKLHELNELIDGVFIDRGVKVFADEVEIIEKNKMNTTSKIAITVHEGKYHQIKRMLKNIGYPVKNLKRVKYGCLELGNMRVGDYRKLKKNEISQLFLMANQEKK